MINNVVIKVNNRIHGKKVIEWWKFRGVDVGHNKGNSEGMYYGVVDGEFGVYEGFDIRTNKDVRVIKLPDISTDNQETPKFFAISPEDWREYQELKKNRDTHKLHFTYIMNIKGEWELLMESFHRHITYLNVMKKVCYKEVGYYIVEYDNEIYLAK